MGNVNMNGTSGASAVSETPFTSQGMSPDELLEYCQMQLGGLDNEMTSQMNQQSLELSQREAVESAETALENFGTTGPQNATDFQTCENAISQAAASLPAGDPVAAQLTQFGQQIATQYGYTPAVPSSPPVFVDPEVAILQREGGELASGALHVFAGASDPGAAQLTKPPANNDWQGTTDTLSNMADGIKSNSEIQMLSLQDLVSQQQQAVQLASGMMSTEDQTIDSVVKNIGS